MKRLYYWAIMLLPVATFCLVVVSLLAAARAAGVEDALVVKVVRWYQRIGTAVCAAVLIERGISLCREGF